MGIGTKAEWQHERESILVLMTETNTYTGIQMENLSRLRVINHSVRAWKDVFLVFAGTWMSIFAGTWMSYFINII